MVWVFGLILFGFALGVVAVLAAEALGVLWILKLLREKTERDEVKIASKTQPGSAELDPQQSLDFALKKQGVVWVLESEKVSKFWLDKTSREQRRKKELLEVSPVKMYGQIKGQSLLLREPEGLQMNIELKGCTVQAVSASSLSSRKWAKRFPIKVESKTSIIYSGSKILYIYLETSWEKEAWCKALHLASCDQEEKVKWFAHLHEEFRSYLISLNSVHHCFMKPSLGSTVEALERDSKPDGASAKVRQFFKKMAKRSSRVGLENKLIWTMSGLEGKKNTEKFRACQDAVLATGLMKAASTSKHLKSCLEDDAVPSSSKSSHSGSQSHHSVSPDADVDEKLGTDEGTLCWNLLISRLFFDVKGSMQLKKSMQARIQRTLSNMRTPSYIGEVICTNIDTGNVPPCIAGMRVLPMEMSEVWALEVDIEYSGGALLEVETRLEVCELELHRDTEDSNPESSSVGAVPSDLIEGFEYFGEQLNLAERKNDLQEQNEGGDQNTDVSKSFKSIMSSAAHGSRWKSALSSLAKQVSQVPFSLTIRVASLRGTLRLHIKPPPSDQLWYGFTSMPDLDFNFESSVGEHKINGGHVALFLVNRIKAAVRETLVLPNCECICIPWMLAEKDDWVSWNVAPFIWINQDVGNETSTPTDTSNQSSGGVKASSASTSSNAPENKQQQQQPPPKSSKSSPEPASKLSDLEDLMMPLLEDENLQETGEDLKECKEPSLQNDTEHETSEQKNMEDTCHSSPGSLVEKQYHSIEQEDGTRKKMGRKERMLDLRKKMGEKLEEKRRHIEEKSRHIVEKMRGP